VRAAKSERTRVLVAAFGHAWLKDYAFGMKVLELVRNDAPAHVELVDWSFGTVAAFQKLAAASYGRAIFVSGTARGRTPGTLHRFTPGEPPTPAELHARIADAVMGVVDVDTLIAMSRYYGSLPEDVVLIEAEPVDGTWGADLSPALTPLLDAAAQAVRAEILRPIPSQRHHSRA
jgi:hydrogenase maturation protease